MRDRSINNVKMTHKSVYRLVLRKNLVESRYWSEKNNSIHCHTWHKKMSTCVACQEIYCLTIVKERSPSRYKKSAYVDLESIKNSRRWLLLPPTSTIRHSVPLSLPALTSISNLYSETPTVLSRALSTSSSEGVYLKEVTRSRSSKKLQAQ